MSNVAISEYLEALASAAPAPGAGSAAALAGALGCSLGEMVCRITIGSDREHGPSPLSSALTALTACRSRLIALGPEDEAAYLRFREAQALTKTSEIERAVRKTAMQSALQEASDVPLQIATQGVLGLEALVFVARFGSKYTLADIATAAYLLSAAASGALENVDVNVSMIQDAPIHDRLTASMASLETQRASTFDAVMTILSERNPTG